MCALKLLHVESTVRVVPSIVGIAGRANAAGAIGIAGYGDGRAEVVKLLSVASHDPAEAHTL
jgi:hypothetical protein